MKKPDQSELICQLQLELAAQEEQMGAMSRGALKAQETIEQLGSENRELMRRVDHLRWKLHHRNLNHEGDFDECKICPVRVTIHDQNQRAPVRVLRTESPNFVQNAINDALARFSDELKSGTA